MSYIAVHSANTRKPVKHLKNGLMFSHITRILGEGNAGMVEKIGHSLRDRRLVFFALFVLFCFFCLFRATPEAHGGSQSRGPMGAIAAGLHHSHSNT